MEKVALCIGIGNYQFATKLSNPLNDACDIANKLEKLGYSVTRSENLDRKGLLKAIIKFQQKSEIAETSVIYYAGHGIQNNGSNYLVPIDANPNSEFELEIYCIPIDRLVSQVDVDYLKTKILIFDSCRSNPFSRVWSRGAEFLGFAPILAPSGTLIAFSTSPGKTASDGQNKNGLYTEALLTEISKTDLSIIQVFQNVRQKVLYKSQNQQLPWESTSLLGDFYFNPKTFNPSDKRILAIRKLTARIDGALYKFDKENIDIDDESSEGGVIYRYSANSKLIKIEKQLFFESGRQFEDVYIENDLPIYYREARHEYNVPFYISEEGAEEEGIEPFDENKTKIEINEYFIHDNILIGINKIEDVENQSIDAQTKNAVMSDVNKLINQC